MKYGHTMLYCRKLKNCDLCGKSGHNPLKCWKYSSALQWMYRAEELGRCGECLTLFKADATECTNCRANRVYWKPFESNHKKYQTGEGDSNKVQKCKKELQESKTIIKDLKNKILELEEELKRANTALSEVGRKWTNTLQEKKSRIEKS